MNGRRRVRKSTRIATRTRLGGRSSAAASLSELYFFTHSSTAGRNHGVTLTRPRARLSLPPLRSHPTRGRRWMRPRITVSRATSFELSDLIPNPTRLLFSRSILLHLETSSAVRRISVSKATAIPQTFLSPRSESPRKVGRVQLAAAFVPLQKLLMRLGLLSGPPVD